jgi:1-phosphofructokinase
LDAEGDLLRHGLKADPDLIKPNLFELEKTFGLKLDSREKILRQCRTLVTDDDHYVCVSMGKDGALLVGKKSAYRAPALEVSVKSLQGAGDSMVAGMCKGLLEKLPPPEILRCAMAAAAATIELEGTRFCGLADFARLYPQTQAYQI